MSDAARLAFEHVVIRRMPGFPDGGFTLDGLSAGINVVYGPNASGKTTTARALQALLWPDPAALPRARLAGRFTLDGASWLVELDAGHVVYQRDGSTAGRPALPPIEVRDRYRLALHELLRTEDRRFAEAILRESAGGYDIAAAADALGFDPSPPRPRKLAGTVDRARKRLDSARDREKELRRDEFRLRELEEERERAREAERHARLLGHAGALAEARGREDAAKKKLAEFPDPLAGLRGDEAERVRELDAALAEVEERLRTLEREKTEAERTREQTELPADGLPDALLRKLRKRAQAAEKHRDRIEALEEELAAAREARRGEAERLGASADDERLAGIDLDALEEPAELARDAEQLRAEREAGRGMLDLLSEGSGEDEAPSDRDAAAAEEERVGNGLRLLGRWLRTPGEAPENGRRGLRRLAWAGAALALIAALAVAWPWHWGAGALAAAAVAAAAAAAWMGPRPRGGQEAREAHRREFERLGLDGPKRWRTGAVEDAFERLRRRWAEAALEAQRARERERVRKRLATLDERHEALGRRRARLAETLGAAPEVDAPRLVWLVERIGAWQDADRRVREHTARLEAARSGLADALEALGGRIEPYGIDSPRRAEDAAPAVEALAERATKHAEADGALRTAEQRIEDARQERARLESKRGRIFEEAGLEPDAMETLEAWCARHSAYSEAEQALRTAAHDRERAEAELREHPGYDPSLEERPRDELEEARLEAAETAARSEGLAEEIAAIHERLEQAKRGHAVADALAAVEAETAELREHRERSARAAAGAALAERLQQATRDHGRPAVFRRARERFARITRGRWRLAFEDGEPPAFRAIDANTGRGHGLDALSSGTRVQLLLAVRMAFIDTQERGPRLPIILDEVLGNSDDARARAIIEAAIALAGEGRQLFYFTAQPDEVGKWSELLPEAADVPHTVVDLAEVRRLGRVRALPRVDVPERTVPEPDGRDYRAYGGALGVPAIDPRMDPGGVHLWHLLDDPDELYALLSMGVETWGQLRELGEHGGEPTADRYALPRAAVKALDAIREAWRIGRGRPVDRAVLLDSGAVTDTFIDRVADLCEELDGDGARLVEALEAKRVKGFRTNKREELAEYLEANGYLDPRPSLGPERIRARALAAVEAELRSGRLSLAHLERLLAAFPAPEPTAQARR